MGDEIQDPITHLPADVRRVQPYQATKAYTCPGCQTEIPPGTGHYVVVPEAIDLRRHWHLRCLEWEVTHGARRRRSPRG